MLPRSRETVVCVSLIAQFTDVVVTRKTNNVSKIFCQHFSRIVQALFRQEPVTYERKHQKAQKRSLLLHVATTSDATHENHY